MEDVFCMLSFFRMWARPGDQPQSPVWRKMLDLLCQDQHHPGPHHILSIPSPRAILRPRVLPGLSHGDGELPSAAAAAAAGPAAYHLQAGPPHEPLPVWALVNTEEEECFVCCRVHVLSPSSNLSLCACSRCKEPENEKQSDFFTISKKPFDFSVGPLPGFHEVPPAASI